jgi:hypothetical protein
MEYNGNIDLQFANFIFKWNSKEKYFQKKYFQILNGQNIGMAAWKIN